MKRVTAAIVSLGMAAGVSALTIIPSENVKLSRSDRAILDDLACRRRHDVGFQEMSGWRLVTEKGNSAHASVTCKPHLVTEGYTAYFATGCRRLRTLWKCEEAELKLRVNYLGAGPYDVTAWDLEPEAAMKALACLETGLRARPDLVGAEMKAEPWSLIRRNVNGRPSISAGLSSPVKRCLSVSFAEGCDAGGPVPLDVESDECLDGS